MSMGVYINMEMPKTGRYFVAVDYTDGKNKTVISVMSEFERGDKTRPLLAVHEVIPVPPHWRLIDADKIYDAVEQRYRISSGAEHRCERDLLDLICSAPTIIPAEEGE